MKKVDLSLLALCLATACGGNYSNGDIEFETALPVARDVEAQLPQALTNADAAEYYTVTRNAIATFNAITADVTGLIDAIRAQPPTTRNPGRRTWGPFPDDQHPGWQVRATMAKVADPTSAPFGFRFDYELAVQPQNAAGMDWITLVSGHFNPGAGVRLGTGGFEIQTEAARQAGYTNARADHNPAGDFGATATLALAYNTGSFPLSIHATGTNVSGADNPAYTYDYQAQADGSGELSFVLAGNTPLIQELTIRSRWLSTAAGRADAVVTAGLLTGKSGIDCWGSDTVATFVHRDWDSTKEFGQAASCVF